MHLFYDTETTGLPKRYRALPNDVENWPRVVQIAWCLYDDDRNVQEVKSLIIRPDGFSIPPDAAAVHGITHERAQRDGVPLEDALRQFFAAATRAHTHVAHNIAYDEPVLHAEFLRCDLPVPFSDQARRCTMRAGAVVCKIPSPSGRGYKYPKLKELHLALFGVEFDNQHDAGADTTACARCYFAMVERALF